MNDGASMLLCGNDRFLITGHLDNTSQGHVYFGTDKSNARDPLCIIKQALKLWVSTKRTKHNESCPKDYPNEKAILYYLTNLAKCDNNHRGNYYLSSLKRNFCFNTNGVVKMCDEWEDKQWLYYATEHCRYGDLMEYLEVQFGNYHVIPENVQLTQQWLTMVKDIFQQLVSTVAWMHENGVCHLDLSLENVMISDIKHSNGNVKLTVKIIDFGVAKYFGNQDLIQENKEYNIKKNRTFQGFHKKIVEINKILKHNNDPSNVHNQLEMSKEMKQDYEKIKKHLNSTIHPTFIDFAKDNNINDEKSTDETLFTDKRTCIGKDKYMAPELVYKISDDGTFCRTHGKQYALSDGIYDARKADIWTLGIMLFMMCIGAPLYKEMNPNSRGFRCAFEGHLKSYIEKNLNRGSFVTDDILDLLDKIFKPPKNRITMDKLLQHPFVGLIGLCPGYICS